MQKSPLFALCAVFLLLAAPPALAQSFPEQVGYVTSPPDSRTAKDFAQALMMNNKFMIVTGKLALERSRDPAIRDFATHMIAAHREIWTEMKKITDRSFVNRRLTPPPLFDPPHTKQHRALLISYGPAFDRLYLSQQMQDHQELMATLEGYAGSKSGYPPLQKFARETVPAIRDHQAMLNKIDVNRPSMSGPVAAR